MPNDAHCADIPDCGTLNAALLWAALNAEGLPVEINVLSGTHYVGRSTNSNLLPGLLNQDNTASELWLSGQQGAIVEPQTNCSVFEILPGAPMLSLRNIFITRATVPFHRSHTRTACVVHLTLGCVVDGQGAPAILFHSGVLVIENCTFIANEAALRIHGGSVNILSTTFISNGGSALQQGGAIRAYAGILHIIDSAFLNNSAAEGAAVYADGVARLLFSTSTFLANTATRLGGAMGVAGTASVQLRNRSILLNNRAPLGRGRSVYLTEGSSVIYVLPSVHGLKPARHAVALNFHTGFQRLQSY